MYRKFARIVFSQSHEEIPVKYNVIKKGPDAVMDWYIKKYNPFKMEERSVAGESGYVIKLPLTEYDVHNNQEKTQRILLKTIETLKEFNVEIVSAPIEVLHIIENEVRIADGKYLFPFFMAQASKKILKTLGRDIKKSEFVIINSDNDLTEMLIDNIYNDVNFLTIISDEPAEKLKDKAEDIFDETGLSIRFSPEAKTILTSADVIINAASDTGKYEYFFGRNSVYFDICGDKNSFKDLMLHRNDMFICDSLKLSYNYESLPLEVFELGFYLKSKDYRYILSREYREDIGQNVRKSIKNMKISLPGIYQTGKAISLSSLLQRSLELSR